MINAQNERVTNKARERLAQLALHKYGGVRQMFECLDRNNDKELSLDEFSHALENLEKLFPRRRPRRFARRSEQSTRSRKRRWRRPARQRDAHNSRETAVDGRGRTASDARASNAVKTTP